MGRKYQSKATGEIDRAIHIVATERGTAVICMRPPRAGERGVWVLASDTMADIVARIFRHWVEAEPGWPGPSGMIPDEWAGETNPDIFPITILAATSKFDDKPEISR